MAKTRPWTVAPHRALELLAEGLWHLESEMLGPPFTRRMVVVRLGSGELVVHSAIACDEATMAQIDSLGPVAYLIVPSGYHRMDAPSYGARYLKAKVLAMPAAAPRVREVVRVDGGPELLPADRSLRWEPLAGVPTEGALIHTDPRGEVSVALNDAFMNLPDRPPGWRGLVVRAIGSAGGPKVTPIARWFMVKDRAAYAGHLRRLAALPGIVRVIPSHGDIVDAGAAAALERAAAQLADAPAVTA